MDDHARRAALVAREVARVRAELDELGREEYALVELAGDEEDAGWLWGSVSEMARLRSVAARESALADLVDAVRLELPHAQFAACLAELERAMSAVDRIDATRRVIAALPGTLDTLRADIELKQQELQRLLQHEEQMNRTEDRQRYDTTVRRFALADVDEKKRIALAQEEEKERAELAELDAEYAAKRAACIKRHAEALEHALNHPEKCGICLDLLAAQEVAYTQCMHVYHSVCLEKVFACIRKCPLCSTVQIAEWKPAPSETCRHRTKRGRITVVPVSYTDEALETMLVRRNPETGEVNKERVKVPDDEFYQNLVDQRNQVAMNGGDTNQIV